MGKRTVMALAVRSARPFLCNTCSWRAGPARNAQAHGPIYVFAFGLESEGNTASAISASILRISR